MPREYKVYLRDMLEAIEKIENYTKNMSYDDFLENGMANDAVLRNLEIISEAAKQIPEDVRDENPEVEWKKIA